MSVSRETQRARAAREAVLPQLFLTVGLAGGFRVASDAGAMRFLPPPLIALVLALQLLAVLYRSGLLVPDALLSQKRTALENLLGAVVLASLTFATAQVFNTLAPEAGLLHLVFNLFFLLLVWNTLAAAPSPRQVLRSLMVVFGSAFALKYIILAALYAPDGGLAKRVLTTLLEGVTLGALDYRPDATLTGYVALGTIVLYMIGLVALPRGDRDRSGAPVWEALEHRSARELAASEPDRSRISF